MLYLSNFGEGQTFKSIYKVFYREHSVVLIGVLKRKGGFVACQWKYVIKPGDLVVYLSDTPLFQQNSCENSIKNPQSNRVANRGGGEDGVDRISEVEGMWHTTPKPNTLKKVTYKCMKNNILAQNHIILLGNLESYFVFISNLRLVKENQQFPIIILKQVELS